MREKKKKVKKAFTLVEVLVASIVFVIFITIVSQLFLSSQRTQRFLSNFSEVVDNMSFALERIAREVRMGHDFSLSEDKRTLSFTNAYGEDVSYYLEGGRIMRKVEQKIIPITAENIKVENLIFHLEGEKPDDNKQPKITIIIKFTSTYGHKGEKYSKVVQTTVTPRMLDYPESSSSE